MTHMRLWASAAIIAVVVVASFALSVPRARDVPVAEPVAEATSSAPVVRLADSYRRGVHTITGSVTAPNACTSVTATATLEGDASNTARIVVAVSLPTDTGICLQVPTDISFKTSVEGPEDVSLTATVNGVVASTGS